jgi:hypothetical protein
MSAGSNLPPLPPDTEFGLPVEELDTLELDASPRFLTGVRNKIERRRTAGQLVGYSWELPRVILLEIVGWAKLIQELLGGPKGSR